ncbi:hypothetical protein GJAV_G00026480 [Gymnothorax javanicus]|nr:hypothetical protein GJAV_G00026480 [Gymnothorax javanicus]
MQTLRIPHAYPQHIPAFEQALRRSRIVPSARSFGPVPRTQSNRCCARSLNWLCAWLGIRSALPELYDWRRATIGPAPREAGRRRRKEARRHKIEK